MGGKTPSPQHIKMSTIPILLYLSSQNVLRDREIRGRYGILYSKLGVDWSERVQQKVTPP